MSAKKGSSQANPKPTYKVFISSTYLDNQERRKIVQDAIAMAGMLWHGMERFTASTRPTVEECLGYVREADLLVGIIAWRYGWETEGEEKSITEMEYDAATERLMFQLDPDLEVKPDRDFDPGPERWKKQEKLEAFKQRFSKDQMPTHFTETTLQGKVLAALNQWRERKEGPVLPKPFPLLPAELPPPSARDLEEEIASYGQKAVALHATLPVAGFVTRIQVPIDLEKIYVPLRAMLDLRGVAEESFRDEAHAEERLRGCDGGLEISLPEAFRQAKMREKRGVVILGDPGAGKTTHLKRLLPWCLRNGPETIDLPPGMLPVFLPLRELKNLDRGLDAFIQDQLDSPHLNTPEGFGERLLGRGNLLFLLDGLDEVAELSHRERVAHWIVEALRPHPTCRFVVTCRFARYSPTVQLSEDFLQMHIRPLTEDQAERFVRNWYRMVERSLARNPEQAEGLAAEEAQTLIHRLESPIFALVGSSN